MVEITEKSLLIIVILVILFAAFWQHNENKAEFEKFILNNNLNDKKDEKTDAFNDDTEITNNNYVAPSCPQIIMPPPYNGYRIAREYDYRALTDPLVAPKKRDDYNFPFPSIATRDSYAPYKRMGTLVNKDAPIDDPYRFLHLIGRQRYRSSDYYDYYATEKGSEGNGVLKFPINDRHKELYTGDTITISQLNATYEVHIDKNLEFEYYADLI